MHQAWKQKDKLITMSNITYRDKLAFSVGFTTERKKAEVCMNYNYQNQGPLANHPLKPTKGVYKSYRELY